MLGWCKSDGRFAARAARLLWCSGVTQAATDTGDRENRQADAAQANGANRALCALELTDGSNCPSHAAQLRGIPPEAEHPDFRQKRFRHVNPPFSIAGERARSFSGMPLGRFPPTGAFLVRVGEFSRMAVSPAYTFDYELGLRARHDGAFEGTACSLQERDGTLPGLLGAAPGVSVDGDVVRFVAGSLPSATANLLENFSALIPPLHDWLVDRRLRLASVERMELVVPGLREVLRAGVVLRATSVLQSGVPVDPPLADVSVHSGGVLVRSWASVPART